MREISRLLARLMIVCVSCVAFITECGELSGIETAAGTEAPALETTAVTVSESRGGEEKTVQEEKPRLVENDEEEVTPDRVLMKANKFKKQAMR